jgi:hypothetical protein
LDYPEPAEGGRLKSFQGATKDNPVKISFLVFVGFQEKQRLSVVVGKHKYNASGCFEKRRRTP